MCLALSEIGARHGSEQDCSRFCSQGADVLMVGGECVLNQMTAFSGSGNCCKEKTQGTGRKVTFSDGRPSGEVTSE